MANVSASSETVSQTQFPDFSPLKFDWIYTIFLIWFSAGLFIDTWAHNTYGLELEGFFTPWHAVLYTGYGMTAASLVFFTIKHKTMDFSWKNAVPKGYLASVLGLVIFNIGGIGDGFWHELIGIEVNVDGFYSPPHMLLLTGAVLMWLGPFRAAWQRGMGDTPAQWLPAALSLGLSFSLITFFYQYAFLPVSLQGTGFDGIRPANPVGNNLEGLASAGVIISSISITVVLLLAMKRWGNTLPFGFFGVVMTIFVTGLSLVYATYLNIPLALIAGLIYDVLYKFFLNRNSEVITARLLGFVGPFVFYFIILASWIPQYDIWFNTTMYTGLIYLAGMIGFLTSYLIYAPSIPDIAEE